MWHAATVLIFSRKFLLLAFQHGVQGQADDCCVEKGHIPKRSFYVY